MKTILVRLMMKFLYTGVNTLITNTQPNFKHFRPNSQYPTSFSASISISVIPSDATMTPLCRLAWYFLVMKFLRIWRSAHQAVITVAGNMINVMTPSQIYKEIATEADEKARNRWTLWIMPIFLKWRVASIWITIFPYPQAPVGTCLQCLTANGPSFISIQVNAHLNTWGKDNFCVALLAPSVNKCEAFYALLVDFSQDIRLPQNP